MRKGVIVSLSGATIIHALATLFIVGTLWGRSLTGMDLNGHGKICEVFAFLLSMPILRMAAGVDGDFVLSQIYFMSCVNSIVAIAAVYFIYRWAKALKRKVNGHKNMERRDIY